MEGVSGRVGQGRLTDDGRQKGTHTCKTGSPLLSTYMGKQPL